MSQIEAVILDWAGTVVDHGCQAPTEAFTEVLSHFGVDITATEARAPMGLPKWDHIEALLTMPRVAEAWRHAQGSTPDAAAVQQVYEVFVPANTEVAERHAALIPGALETISALRSRGIAIGSTTGYTREIMERVTAAAARQGYQPDSVVCAGEVPQGRPTPLMVYKSLLDLQRWPLWRCVKVDDTAPGIAEGRNAGCWTVGVSMTGNGMALSQEALAALPAAERDRRNEAVRDELREAGAHFVIDSVADLLPCLDTIEERIADGIRPE
ncbi:phosphonoacetaldehyde hydrolase [Arhodomonas sp. SL1]|uniref:phosphonoacetaldehyde hydrolase n=1 Tax=Arhodomonas sp. SL1 TaxID=3425691 RepID=UPI003F883504